MIVTSAFVLPLKQTNASRKADEDLNPFSVFSPIARSDLSDGWTEGQIDKYNY